MGSSPGRSDRSGSSVEGPPLLVISWLVTLDSQVVSVTTIVVSDDESSSVSSVGSQLESDSISKWLGSVETSSLVDEPGLVKTVMAVPEDDVSVVSVGSTMDIEALSSVVLDVSS